MGNPIGFAIYWLCFGGDNTMFHIFHQSRLFWVWCKMSMKLEISDEIRSFCSGERCSPYTVLFFRFSELSVVVGLKSVTESLIFSNKPMSVLVGRDICWAVVFRNDT